MMTERVRADSAASEIIFQPIRQTQKVIVVRRSFTDHGTVTDTIFLNYGSGWDTHGVTR